MDQLEHTSEAVWQARQEWFEDLFDTDKRGGGVIISEHGNGLLIDLQSIYCVGAFVSCIILSCTIIDAQFQDVEGATGSIENAFRISDHAKELEWLRRRRNRLIHFKEGLLPVSVDSHWSDRLQHKKDAERAIQLVAKVLFETPWV